MAEKAIWQWSLSSKTLSSPSNRSGTLRTAVQSFLPDRLCRSLAGRPVRLTQGPAKGPTSPRREASLINLPGTFVARLFFCFIASSPSPHCACSHAAVISRHPISTWQVPPLVSLWAITVSNRDTHLHDRDIGSMKSTLSAFLFGKNANSHLPERDRKTTI